MAICAGATRTRHSKKRACAAISFSSARFKEKATREWPSDSRRVKSASVRRMRGIARTIGLSPKTVFFVAASVPSVPSSEDESRTRSSGDTEKNVSEAASGAASWCWSSSVSSSETAARKSARASFSGFAAFKSTSVGGIDTPSSNSSRAVRRTAANESTDDPGFTKNRSVAKKRLRHVSTCRAAKRAPRFFAKRRRNVFAQIEDSSREVFSPSLVSSRLGSCLVSSRRNMDPNRCSSAKKSLS